ncbi:MAG: histidine ammonia-lyase [Chlamydiales bacterium]|nr:histidine ammonia-lyase [Chlamydiales bacterium]
MLSIIVLDGSSLTLEQAQSVALGTRIAIAPSSRKAVNSGRAVVEAIVKDGKPVYGVNTGFGYYANEGIPTAELLHLQEHIVLSHASGHGKSLSIPETRLAMTLRLNVLLKGLTGVRYQLCEALADLINHEIYPLIPEFGSVGASGDLAPLAHLALALIGKGRVMYHGKEMSASVALDKAGLKAVVLAEKEGLGLINGTQIMCSVGGLALIAGIRLVQLADLVVALTYDAMSAKTNALKAELHLARGQPGQIESARVIREHLQGSYLHAAKTPHKHVQDAYSLRCAPQVHGPSRETVLFAAQTVARELNAATDNPLVFPDGHAVAGGNFHGQSLALAFDIASLAFSEIANISERRLEQLLNPHRSGLAAFLTMHPGLESGYMAAQYLSASLVNEGKLLANPACTDSIPGNVGVEDHVSMGMTSARKLRALVSHVEVVLAVEAMAAAQAVDLRKVGPLGKGSQVLYNAIRTEVPTLKKDRIVALDVEGAVRAIRTIM